MFGPQYPKPITPKFTIFRPFYFPLMIPEKPLGSRDDSSSPRRFNVVSNNCRPGSGFQQAPEPLTTAIGVRMRIFKSSQGVQDVA